MLGKFSSKSKTTIHPLPPCTQSQTHPNSTATGRAPVPQPGAALRALSPPYSHPCRLVRGPGRAAAHLTLPGVAAVVGEHECGADVVAESANLVLLLREHALQHREDTLACRRVRRQGEDDGGGGEGCRWLSTSSEPARRGRSLSHTTVRDLKISPAQSVGGRSLLNIREALRSAECGRAPAPPLRIGLKKSIWGDEKRKGSRGASAAPTPKSRLQLRP